MLDLEESVSQLESWDGALVLIRGAGSQAFCSGGDLRSVREHLLDSRAAAAMSMHMAQTLDRLARLPQLVVAAIDGAALGGGAELALSADQVFMAKTALLGFVHITLGVSPGWGGGRRLVQRVGEKRALQILVEGERLTAEQAKEQLLVERVCACSAVEEARGWFRALAHCAPEAIRAAVRVTQVSDPDHEREQFLSLWGGPAHRRALERARTGS